MTFRVRYFPVKEDGEIDVSTMPEAEDIIDVVSGHSPDPEGHGRLDYITVVTSDDFPVLR